jgi:hypothetical protein
LRGPFARTFPVSAVGDAVVEGIERRRRWIVVPPWAAALLWLRPLVYRISEAQGARTMPEFERIAADELSELGDEAGRPVGPGGQAASEAARRRATA